MARSNSVRSSARFTCGSLLWMVGGSCRWSPPSTHRRPSCSGIQHEASRDWAASSTTTTSNAAMVCPRWICRTVSSQRDERTNERTNQPTNQPTNQREASFLTDRYYLSFWRTRLFVPPFLRRVMYVLGGVSWRGATEGGMGWRDRHQHQHHHRHTTITSTTCGVEWSGVVWRRIVVTFL